MVCHKELPIRSWIGLLIFALLFYAIFVYFSPISNFVGVTTKIEPVLDSNEMCNTIEGHMGMNNGIDEKPWKQMKWIGMPAPCPVKGHLIEKLDPENNFRRGWALKFTEDIDDRMPMYPWLLGSRMNLNYRPRRVYIDLGGNQFSTSILWFLRMYPCDFTEVHAFETDSNLLKLPPPFDEDANYAPIIDRGIKLVRTPEVPQWMLDRIKIYYKFVGDVDDEQKSLINITRFIKEELQLKSSDTVVVKMDIENSEWPILKRWNADPEMPQIIDELFLELHYDHPTLRGYGPHTRDEAVALFAEMRLHGFFVHPWA